MELFAFTVKGLGRLTSKKMPTQKELQLVAYKGFVSADANRDNTMDMQETINWVELNEHFISFLNRFEPEHYIKYEDVFFQKFPQIDLEELEYIALNTMQSIKHLAKHT